MRGTAPFWIDSTDDCRFPDVGLALREPDGLLAIGGDLRPERLMLAYRQGIFPWYNDDQPILWWSPDPRTVLLPQNFHVSRSLRKVLRQERFRITFDQAFADVVDACAAPRARQSGTWITADMRAAYIQLHELGFAHAIECWDGDRLVGGMYGVGLGRVFFGESMFSRVDNASKALFAQLAAQLRSWQFGMIDCQIASAHLSRLGAVSIPRKQYVRLLDHYCPQPGPALPWRFNLPDQWWNA